MSVVWKRVQRSPYRAYEVSSDGRVRRDGRELGGYVDRYGYRTVLLSYAGLARRFSVHRLVCEAFHGPAPDRHEVAHLDGNRRNNSATNLKWATSAENNSHKKAHGTHQAGERHPGVKLTAEQVAAIRASTASTRKIAAEFDIGQTQVVRIRNGQRWASDRAASRPAADALQSLSRKDAA